MFKRATVSEVDADAGLARLILPDGTVTARLPWMMAEVPEVDMVVSVLFYDGAGYADGLIVGVY